jgi:hypothetical protein
VPVSANLRKSSCHGGHAGIGHRPLSQQITERLPFSPGRTAIFLVSFISFTFHRKLFIPSWFKTVKVVAAGNQMRPGCVKAGNAVAAFPKNMPFVTRSCVAIIVWKHGAETVVSGMEPPFDETESVASKVQPRVELLRVCGD